MKAVFSDFDEFADSIHGIAGRFVPTARPESDWWISTAPIGALALQQLQIGGATTYAGGGTPDTLTFGIPMTTPERTRIDGLPLDDNSFIFLKRDQPFTFAARETTRWAGITIRFDHDSMQPLLYEAARDRTEQGNGTRARSELRYLSRLRAFVARICAIDDSVTFLDPAAERAAEQEILTCAAHALESESEEHSNRLGRPSYSRERVIARSLALIEANAGKPLFIDDLCRATEVSERTLRNIFQEYFDVGPMRLLKLRQLVEIRAALLSADPQIDLVTQIAARFGIWDFSLFARNYKALFGETPSTTLRMVASAQREETSWIQYAAKKFIGTDMPSAAE